MRQLKGTKIKSNQTTPIDGNQTTSVICAVVSNVALSVVIAIQVEQLAPQLSILLSVLNPLFQLNSL